MMFAVAAAFIWPGAVVAQEEMAEEAKPPMLMISSWKCDFGSMGAIGEDWNERSINAAQAAVDMGAWAAAGVFYHDWADEWNVNFWAVGPDVATLIEGQEVSNVAYDELYPEGLNLWDHCSEHKDGFYQLAESADTDDNTEGPGPAMAVSSWKCTDVGAVADAWDEHTLPRAQAVVDAGLWSDAGVFYHAWAGEWNVNYYYMGEDIPAILEGWQAFIDSMGDDAPDITDYCSEHKDGFYSFGPTAQSASESD
jgi:hypothetical protein